MSPMMPRQSPDDAPLNPPKGGGVFFCAYKSYGTYRTYGPYKPYEKAFQPTSLGEGRGRACNMAHIGR